MVALQVVLLVRRMDAVVLEPEADQDGVQPERILEVGDDGIEPPLPISTASLPHSSVSARLAAASGFMVQSSAIAGALVWSAKSAEQSAGSCDFT